MGGVAAGVAASAATEYGSAEAAQQRIGLTPAPIRAYPSPVAENNSGLGLASRIVGGHIRRASCGFFVPARMASLWADRAGSRKARQPYDWYANLHVFRPPRLASWSGKSNRFVGVRP